MKSYKILILEWESNSLHFLKAMLRKYGYQVEQMTASSQIVPAILDSNPHLIILDTFRYENDSLHLCNTLKKNKSTALIPVIAYFNCKQNNNRIGFIDKGADDYIEQPFHEPELMVKIKNQLKIVQLEHELRLSNKALEETIYTVESQKNELENNLSLAAKIQEALIPHSLGNIPNCTFLWHFQPSGKVGGDIFDVFMLDEDHMGAYMIDVMGHGLASSMLAVALSEFLIIDVDRGSPLKRKTEKPPCYEIITPLEVILYLNKRFPFTKYQHYFTIFYMILNVKTGELKYVRAAHPSPILVKATGEIHKLDGYGTPVGFEFVEGYEEKTLYLDSGDQIIIYTDGLFELKEKNGNSIDYEGIIRYLQNEHACSGNQPLTLNLKKMVRSQEKMKDDLSILEIKWIKFI